MERHDENKHQTSATDLQHWYTKLKQLICNGELVWCPWLCISDKNCIHFPQVFAWLAGSVILHQLFSIKQLAALVIMTRDQVMSFAAIPRDTANDYTGNNTNVTERFHIGANKHDSVVW